MNKSGICFYASHLFIQSQHYICIHSYKINIISIKWYILPYTLHTLQRWLLCEATLKWPMPSNLTLSGMCCTTGRARAVGIGKALRIRYTFTICRLKFKRSNGSVVYASDLLYKSTATSKVCTNQRCKVCNKSTKLMCTKCRSGLHNKCTNKGQYHFFYQIPIL